MAQRVRGGVDTKKANGKHVKHCPFAMITSATEIVALYVQDYLIVSSSISHLALPYFSTTNNT